MNPFIVIVHVIFWKGDCQSIIGVLVRALFEIEWLKDRRLRSLNILNIDIFGSNSFIRITSSILFRLFFFVVVVMSEFEIH